jgi:UDP-2-acetamido-2,6-beta-L-arabino-hexul-4-ose reductase
MKDIRIESLEKRADERGWLIEVLGQDTLRPDPGFGQMHVSVAHPGKVRGNHYHTRKLEWFCVPSGVGLLRLQDLSSGEVRDVRMGEHELKTVQITPGVIHAIKNIGEKDMVLIVYSNEKFNPADPDTVYQKILE